MFEIWRPVIGLEVDLIKITKLRNMQTKVEHIFINSADENYGNWKVCCRKNL